MIKYFAYGMNTNLHSMSWRCPTARSLGSAVLPGYEFRFATHADIVENPELECHGVLWDITKKDLRSLDSLEGYPFYYDRKVVEVQHNGTIVRALTYFMNPGNTDKMPAPGYLDMLLKGYEENSVPAHQIHEAIHFIKTTDKLEFEYDHYQQRF